MTISPLKHHRQSIRLRGYNYSRPGVYFVTMCVKNRECLFGDIKNGIVVLNEVGQIAKKCWIDIPKHFPNVTIDEFVIMPNHVHGILIIREFSASAAVSSVGATDSVAPAIGTNNGPFRATDSVAPTKGPGKKRPNGPPAGSLGAIIGQYKSVITKRMNATNRTPGNFRWQRDFFDHIGRNEHELNHIRQYIRNNPANWVVDDENPTGKTPKFINMVNPQRQYSIM